MSAIPIPSHWTSAQADAAITLVEAILDALWRQYPEPWNQDHLSSDHDCDGPCEPPTPGDDEETDNGFRSGKIPF